MGHGTSQKEMHVPAKASDLGALVSKPDEPKDEAPPPKPEKVEVLTPENAKTIAGLPVRKVAALKPWINILVYGDPGVGKTVLAGSASAVEAMSPVLIIDIEGGTLSLESMYPDVETIEVKTWKDMMKVYNSLRKGEGGYKTVVLDSLTEIQKFSMDLIMKDVVDENSSRDPDVPGMREWGKNVNQTRQLVRLFRDLKMNVIFTALSEVKDNEKTGKTTIKPSLSGKVKNEIAGFVDIVAYMYVKVRKDQQQRLLLTSVTDQVTAKDRSGRLPMVVEEPTMPMLWSYMYDADNGNTEGV